MPTEVVMPKLGLNMSEGLLVEWLVNEGDRVKRGDALFVVETDKVTTESQAQVDGVLGKILVKAGETVPVRTVVGLILMEGETLDSGAPLTPAPEETPSETISTPATTAAAAPVPARTGKVIASPLAKRIAAENGIDLAAVQGSGPDGRISQEDVERAIAERKAGDVSVQAAAPQAGQTSVAMEGVRAVIAERMYKSVQSTAQVTLHSEVDASGLVAYREKLKAEPGVRADAVPGYNAILASVAAQALKQHPRMNARQAGNQIELLPDAHIGIAVDTEAGLMVVVVRDADKKTVDAIHQELNALTTRALNRKSQPDDLTGSTFTITNLGGLGIDGFTPILNAPEVGILGVGRIREQLVIQDGRVTQMPVVTLSLTFDHRLIDGAPAARFLQEVAAGIGRLA
jgi:pyruvate dehydrogenase E2 component (dihydrolipoamide acetyltransferase)